jgi:hypothetical protein
MVAQWFIHTTEIFMIVIWVDYRDDDTFKTLRDCPLFALNPFRYITNNELMFVDNTAVQTSGDPDLDQTGGDISMEGPPEKRSTRSKKKTSMPLEGKL